MQLKRPKFYPALQGWFFFHCSGSGTNGVVAIVQSRVSRLRHVFVVLILIPVIQLTLFFPLLAQENRPSPYEIVSLDVSGNDVLPTSRLQSAILTRETPGFINKFLHGTISEALGRKTEYFDPVLFTEDINRLRQLYEDYGFFEVQIDTTLRFSEQPSEIGISIVIHEGYRSIIDTMSYRGILNVPEFVLDDIESGRTIAQGDPYQEPLLQAQIGVVLRSLRNAGYANARYVADSSYVLRFASSRNVTVLLTFDIGRRYRFGEVEVVNEAAATRDDITDDIIMRQLDFEPLKIYSEEDVVLSERNLNRVGIFDLARVRVKVPPEEDTTIFIPSTITVRPAARHEIAPELLISDENGNFNIGTGIGYKHRNFFGGARTFSTRLRFRTQTIGKFPEYFKLRSEAVSNIDLTLEMLQPYIFSNKIKGSWTLSVILDKQRPYRQFIIRNKFGITDKIAHFTNGFLDWSLERVELRRNPDIVGSDIASPEELQQLEAQEKRVQFNSIISFTISRDKTNDIFSPSSGFIHTATVEEAGLLPLLLKKAQPDLPFTQFYRLILLGRWYHDPLDTRFTILGFKLKGGFEEKYGESRGDANRAIPQSHRFYAGGGASNRGWESRRLAATGDPNLELGGNLLLESSLELRINVLQSLKDGFLDKFWAVFFLDAGNVWGEIGNFKLRDVAVATGLGIRYDTFFGPFRIDFGIRVYDPRPIGGQSKWITGRKLFGETIGEGILHLGIGHAF